jgi:molecular chaperone DnaK
LAGTDIDAVKSAHESLLTASNEFTRRLYENVQAQQASAAGGAPGADEGQPSDDEVADAEIVDDDQQSA